VSAPVTGLSPSQGGAERDHSEAGFGLPIAHMVTSRMATSRNLRAVRRLSTAAFESKAEYVFEPWSFLTNRSWPILNMTKMMPAVQYTPPDTSVLQAMTAMCQKRAGSLLVSADGQEIQGLITERDVLDKVPLEPGSAARLTVAELMTPRSSMITADTSFTLEKCVKTMRAGGFRHLPVEHNSEITAVISMRDIASHVSAALSKAPFSRKTTVAELLAALGNVNKDVHGLTSANSVGDAVRLMRSKRAGAVLINANDIVKGFGIVSERDYFTKVAVYGDRNPDEIPISSIMTEIDNIKSVSSGIRVADCLHFMVKGNFRHLPVLKQGMVVGVISMRDIMYYLLGSGM